AVTVRVSRRLHRALDSAARERDQSVAAFLRELAVRAVRAAADVEGDAFPSPPRNPITIPPDDLKAVSLLTARLAVVGGSVVQLCKSMRLASHPEHESAEGVLDDLRAAQHDLVEIVRILKSEVSK